MSHPAPNTAARVDPADEGSHPQDPADALWSESFYMDAISDDGALGFYIRIGDTRNLGGSMMSLTIARPGKPSIILSDQRAPLPVHQGLKYTVSAPDYTATFEPTDPVRRYVVTFAGAARSYRDAGAILRGEDGTPVTVAADLTWVTDGIDYRWPGPATRYEIPCRVSGTITIDGQAYPFAGNGQRDHSWGNRDWWGSKWMWNAFWLSDGSRVHATIGRGIPWARGYWQLGEDLVELGSGRTSEDYDGDGHISGASFTLDEPGADVTVTPTAYGNLLLVSPDGKVAHFIRAMADFTAADGRTGRGWIEWEYLIDADGKAS